MNHYSTNIQNITHAVIEKIGDPVSPMVVLATIESMGVRDKDVFLDFGFVSLRDLSVFVFEDLKERELISLKNGNEQKKKGAERENIPVSDYLWIKAKLFVQYYPLGIFHLLPVFLQVAAIILFGYSLWTFIGFNIVQSTSVVFGVILGLILSGGFVQVLGRQASFYWHHQEYGKCKIIIDKVIQIGLLGILVSFGLIAMVNFLFHFYPSTFILITFVYAFLIGALLLYTAPFHTLKKRWAISLAVFFATAVALLLNFYTEIHIYFTHWIGIGIAILVSKILLNSYFKKYKKGTNQKDIVLNKYMVIYKNYRYFLYGALVYIFVFIDRILAWSADAQLTHQFLFLYEKNYEIGMDLAILVFFMLAGVLEYAIASFSRFLDLYQKSTSFLIKQELSKKLYKMYWNHIGLFLITAFFTAVLIFLIITQPWGYRANFGVTLDVLSIKVCFIGGLGYLFFTWGMLNALYLYTLDRPRVVLKALFISCAVNFAIGFVCSRMVGYEYSVVGMLIGSITFMVLTLKAIRTFLKNLDYHYYAAY
ncbi:exopolysaccharide Pel transporter PelG [Arenibacter palladensis]|uniref:exopolysaccharide Pel transporter PelG n=1 Tax=Arenibacter palladensis TaxID=237373 RepID=UPI0026E4161A|nr:exopolysaccharide Pel transporter PelG [Arenibacter palladensis]MDO6604155.1 exopolysaccharide Pel transporter PelG [Arenibacter palladensis]